MKHRPFCPPLILAMASFFVSLVDVRSQSAAEIPPPPAAHASLAHVALRAADIEQSLAFYRDYLGLTERFRTDQVPGKANVYYTREKPPAPREGRLLLVDLRIGDHHALELFAGRDPGQPVVHHVALRMNDLGAARDALERNGATVPPAPAAGATALKAFFVSEPSGHTLELLPLGPPAKPRPPGAPAFSISDLRGVILPLHAPTESESFYRHTLGLDDAFLAIGQSAPPAARNRAAGPSLILSSAETEPTACLGVRDLAALHARLQTDALSLGLAPPTGLEHGPHGERFLMLRDPDGLRVRLDQIPVLSTEPETPPPAAL